MTSANVSTIYPLANPKGVAFLCELCNKDATIICTKCRVTYYCNKQHQQADWIGIHKRICPLLIPLRTKNVPPIPFLPILEEAEFRKKTREKQQQELLTITTTVANRLLFEGKPENSLPAALQSLHLTIDLYGASTFHLVEPYLILAKASLGLGRIDQAEGYLSQAEWTILKTPDCPRSLIHKLAHCFGQLFLARGNYQKARRHFGEDIYYAASEFGTNSIHTAAGYYGLSKCFEKELKKARADSLIEKVIDVWCEYLTQITKEKVFGPAAAVTVPYLNKETEDAPKFCLDEAQAAEGILVLNAIYKHKTSTKQTDAVAKVAHCLAMLNFIIDRIDMAIEYAEIALTANDMQHPPPFMKDADTFMNEYTHVRIQRESKAMEGTAD